MVHEVRTDEEELVYLLASSSRGFSGSWSAYLLSGVIMLHDLQSDKVFCVTPAFMIWLTRTPSIGKSVAAILGSDDR